MAGLLVTYEPFIEFICHAINIPTHTRTFIKPFTFKLSFNSIDSIGHLKWFSL